MSDAVSTQANAIRRYVRSQNNGKGISKAKSRPTGTKVRKTRTGQLVKTSKRTRGNGTITQSALKRLRSKK